MLGKQSASQATFSRPKSLAFFVYNHITLPNSFDNVSSMSLSAFSFIITYLPLPNSYNLVSKACQEAGSQSVRCLIFPQLFSTNKTVAGCLPQNTLNHHPVPPASPYRFAFHIFLTLLLRVKTLPLKISVCF